MILTVNICGFCFSGQLGDVKLEDLPGPEALLRPGERQAKLKKKFHSAYRRLSCRINFVSVPHVSIETKTKNISVLVLYLIREFSINPVMVSWQTRDRFMVFFP